MQHSDSYIRHYTREHYHVARAILARAVRTLRYGVPNENVRRTIARSLRTIVAREYSH